MDCDGDEEKGLQENVEGGMQANRNLLYPQERRHVWSGNFPLYSFAHQPTLPLVWPRVLPLDMRRDPTCGNVVVGGYAIGASHGLPTFDCNSNRKRRKRCSLCRDSPDPNRNTFAEECNGSGSRDWYQWTGS